MIEQDHATIENRVLTQDDLPFEFMLGALRLIDGVPTVIFSEQTGLGLNAISKPIAEALRKGLLDEDPTRLKANSLGMRYLNDLQELFLK